MFKPIIATTAAAVFASFSVPAQAGSEWTERVDLCAAAIDAEGIADVAEHRIKFAGGNGGGRLKKVIVSLTPIDGGDVIKAECAIRRGEIISVELKS